MSNISGAVSGTKVIVGVESAPDSGTYNPLPGETSHSLSDTLEAIDITNKSEADVRCYLEGEGRRLLELTIEAIHNDDGIISQLYTAYDSKTFIRCRRTIGTRNVTSLYMVTNISDSPGLNTAVTDSFTLSSTGPIVVS